MAGPKSLSSKALTRALANPRSPSERARATERKAQRVEKEAVADETWGPATRRAQALAMPGAVEALPEYEPGPETRRAQLAARLPPPDPRWEAAMNAAIAEAEVERLARYEARRQAALGDDPLEAMSSRQFAQAVIGATGGHAPSREPVTERRPESYARARLQAILDRATDEEYAAIMGAPRSSTRLPDAPPSAPAPAPLPSALARPPSSRPSTVRSADTDRAAFDPPYTNRLPPPVAVLGPTPASRPRPAASVEPPKSTPTVRSGPLTEPATVREPPRFLARNYRSEQDACMKNLIQEALDKHGGNRTHAARALNMTRGGFYKAMDRLGVA